MKETDLAEKVIFYLEDLDWEVFQEVQPGRYGKIADIVARFGKLTWVVECKKSLTFTVIEQAMEWKRYATLVSIAVPVAVRGGGRGLAYRTCAHFGVGVFEVGDSQAMVRAISPINRRIQSFGTGKYLHEALCPEHKTSAKAGTSQGGYWTPFRATCRNVVAYVTRNPGATMKEVIDGITHHYASDKGARTSIPYWIERGKIEGVRVERDKNRIRLFPAKEASNDD